MKLFEVNYTSEQLNLKILGKKYNIINLAPNLLFPYVIKKTKVRKQKSLPYLAIAAIMKDEARDIVEWIEFHKLVGVDKFYLYDNESSDDTYKKIKPYIKSGLVDYRYVKGTSLQFPVYRDAIERYKNECTWLALIDLDEFLCPVEVNNLKDLLKDYEDYPALVVNSIRYDCNDVKERNDKDLLIETFTRISSSDLHNGKLVPVKSIVNPNKVAVVNHPHVCWYVNDEKAVNEDFEPVVSEQPWYTDGANIDKIRLNHYYAKSIAEYEEKKLKPYADIPRKRVVKESWLHIPDPVQDYVICRFLPKLKESMKL